jgi:hypothetical protein
MSGRASAKTSKPSVATTRSSQGGSNSEVRLAGEKGDKWESIDLGPSGSNQGYTAPESDWAIINPKQGGMSSVLHVKCRITNLHKRTMFHLGSKVRMEKAVFSESNNPSKVR